MSVLPNARAAAPVRLGAARRAPLIYVFSNLSFPPREGQHLNSLLLLRAMREAGHAVSVLTWVRHPVALDAPAMDAWIGGLEQLSVQPTRLNYPLLLLTQLLPGLRAGALWRQLCAVLARQPGAVVQLEGIGLLPWVARLRGPAVVVSTTDAWSLRQRRLAACSGSRARRFILNSYAALSAWAERRWMPQAAAVHVVSPDDAVYLRRSVPAARVHDIPIALPHVPPHAPSPVTPPIVLVWCDIGVPHLVAGLRWLLSEVMPLVQSPPGVRWQVLGRREPPAALRALAPDVQFLTWVDDLDTLLGQAHVVLLPDSQGTGLKNRAAQAMACAVPVVGTPAAFEGFPVKDGHEAFVRADAAAFARAITLLLQDPVRAATVGDAGRAFVLARYTVEAMAAAWSALYARLHGRSAPAGVA